MNRGGKRTGAHGRDLRKAFSRGRGQTVQALDGVSLEAEHGTLTALVGPDGAGKTTLIRLAAGLLTADSGELRVLGIDVAADPQQVQARIGYMPQRFGLYEDLTVQENLNLYADLHGVTADERQEKFPQLMEMTALGPFTDRLAGRALGRHEAEAGAGLHAGPLAGAVAAGRADRRRRSALAARIVGDHLAPRSRPGADRAGQHVVSGRGRAVQPRDRA